ncbi:MAG: hypothetical protein ACM33B_14225 [Pseudomonadota bacterium]
MDETAAVLQRLSRIEALDRAGAPAVQLLEELRHLVREAEAWSAHEGDARADAAVDRCRAALEGAMAATG